MADNLNAQSIDRVIELVRSLFQEEHQALLEEVADLMALLEDEDR